MDIYQKVLASRNASDFDHQQHDQQLMQMMDQMIREQVPQIVKEELSKATMDVQTYLNGRAINDGSIKQAVLELLKEAL